MVYTYSIDKNIKTSLFGGNHLKVYGKGFDIDNIKKNKVNVCGYRCKTIEKLSTFAELICELPVVKTSYIK